MNVPLSLIPGRVIHPFVPVQPLSLPWRRLLGTELLGHATLALALDSSQFTVLAVRQIPSLRLIDRRIGELPRFQARMFGLSNSGLDPDDMMDMMDFLEEDSYAMTDTPNFRPTVIPDTPNHRPMVISDSPNRRPMVMSDIFNPRPMVNSKLLRKYVGRRVTTVVKVLRVEGGNLVGELPDGAPITVHRAPQHVAAQSMFVEVIGVVESNRSLRAQTCTGFGDDFDISTYNELLCLLSITENCECF